MVAGVLSAQLEGLRLGAPAEPLALASRAEQRAATLAMLRQARRSVELVSWRLDPPIYGDPEVCEELKRMALASRRARIRALVLDPQGATRRGHRLIRLARRLSSFFELRAPGREHADYAAAFLIVDGTGVITRPHADRYEGEAEFSAPARARSLASEFEEMWALALPDPELRELHL